MHQALPHLQVLQPPPAHQPVQQVTVEEAAAAAATEVPKIAVLQASMIPCSHPMQM